MQDVAIGAEKKVGESMPGRKRYDALQAAVSQVQLPQFVSKDGSYYLDSSFDGSAWETLKNQTKDVAEKASDLNDHPHLHDDHQDKAGDLKTAADTLQGLVMTSYNEWRAKPEGQECKQTEAMIGLGSALQFMRGKLNEFDQGKLDAYTTL